VSSLGVGAFQEGLINKKPPRDLWDPFGGLRLLGSASPVSAVMA